MAKRLFAALVAFLSCILLLVGCGHGSYDVLKVSHHGCGERRCARLRGVGGARLTGWGTLCQHERLCRPLVAHKGRII